MMRCPECWRMVALDARGALPPHDESEMYGFSCVASGMTPDEFSDACSDVARERADDERPLA